MKSFEERSREMEQNFRRTQWRVIGVLVALAAAAGAFVYLIALRILALNGVKGI